MSAAGVSNEVVRELEAICGEEHVPKDRILPWIEEAVRQAGRIPNPSLPVRVHPGSVEEVAAILRLANARGFSVSPVGSNRGAASHWNAEVLLYTDRLSEIEHYDPADLTVGVGAGMSVGQLNALVGADNLMFACDPANPECATIGGVLAAAKHGPLRHGYGAVRDFCIGIRFVAGDGRKAKGGGRVVKNVAGYDLMKLFIGSYGTLAVITSASFKLFPTPRQTRTFIAEFSSWQETLKFRDLIVRSPLSPMCLELISPEARVLMRPENSDDGWVICVRAAGSNAVLVRYRKELGSAVTRELEGDAETNMWKAIADFPLFDDLDRRYALRSNTIPGGPRSPSALPGRWSPSLISIFAPPAELRSVLKLFDEFFHPETTKLGIVGRVGIGHLLVHFATSGPDSNFLRRLRERLPHSVQLRYRWEGAWIERECRAQLRAVQQALDPNNVLRGRELF